MQNTAFNNKEGRWFYWVSAGRLTLLLLLLIAAYLLPIQGILPTHALLKLSWLLGAAFLLSVIFNLWYRIKGLSPWLIRLQTLSDIGLVTLTVFWSGGTNSPFIFLYPLAIITSCLLQAPRGGTVAAVLSTLSFGAICVQELPTQAQLVNTAFNFFVNMAAFNATALLASSLAKKISHTEKQLVRVKTNLQRMEQIHRHVANSLQAGLITVDEKGCITSYNKASSELLCVELPKTLEKPLSYIWPEGAKLLNDLCKQKDSPRKELVYKTPKGEERLLGVSTFNLKDEEGNNLGCGMIFQDITDIKAQEEQRQRTERLAALGEMAAGLAHEIRNPLASMSGAAQFLREAGLVFPEGEKLINIIIRESQRLEHLTESFLLYARPSKGTRESFLVKNEASKAIQLIKVGQKIQDLKLEMDIPDELELQLDIKQFHQVLVNLLLNAFEAVRDKNGNDKRGHVCIRAKRVEGGVKILVQDNGKGIAKKDLSKVFDPFFTTRPDGTGLGLAVVHRLVKAWDGEVHISSQEGSGCTVEILIPQGHKGPA